MRNGVECLSLMNADSCRIGEKMVKMELDYLFDFLSRCRNSPNDSLPVCHNFMEHSIFLIGGTLCCNRVACSVKDTAIVHIFGHYIKFISNIFFYTELNFNEIIIVIFVKSNPFFV